MREMFTFRFRRTLKGVEPHDHDFKFGNKTAYVAKRSDAEHLIYQFNRSPAWEYELLEVKPIPIQNVPRDLNAYSYGGVWVWTTEETKMLR